MTAENHTKVGSTDSRLDRRNLLLAGTTLAAASALGSVSPTTLLRRRHNSRLPIAQTSSSS
jgi:hypothetical protein